ncbi:ABC transporter substrate-binding protein [Bifidobacterium sp.]|jgi:peptide/nickel transport system substrate-binding protein|uniref:ABC transporter substrate-binding protein n=1 Tax=Bifidobacterium sp. TaxID=41200 RepID=UPI0025BB05B7|nr:ABC transporter substrate-binding protein [Bifidobacterium sp.]MCH4209334.1 ABC transporter substrate-binding protein [Bifidobacterium sp.]MCI1224128.1 ABC transporter substrate-binding protein [Bifidobacterium sp.]
MQIRHWKKLHIVSALAAGAALLLSGCGGSSSSNASSGTFTTIDENQSINVNAPINPYNQVANMFVGYNKEQLAWFKYSISDPTAYAPAIAKSWDVSADGHTVTVHIDPNANWSDGKPVTADDVKASFALSIANGNSPVTVASSDDKTVKITQPATVQKGTLLSDTLSTDVVPGSFWDAQIPSGFWDDVATQLSASASSGAKTKAAGNIAAFGKKMTSLGPKKDISCGPFTLDRVNPSEAILKKNPHYFAASNIDPTQVVLKSYNSNQQIWTYLKSGQLDVAPYTSTSESMLKSILAVKGNGTVEGVSFVSASLAFNQSVKPFDNVWVRRGIAYAIDRATATKIGESTSGSPSGPTTGMISTVNDLYLKGQQLDSYDHSATKAAECFTKAGLKKVNGKWQLPDGKPFTVNIQVANGFSDWVAAGKSITSDLSAAGVTSQLNTSADYATYLSDLAAGKFPVGFWLVALGPSAYNAFQRVYGSSNGWTVSGDTAAHSPAGKNGNWMGGPETEQVDGSTIDPGDLAAKLQSASGSQQTDIVKQLAALTNDQLPIIQIWDYKNLQFVNDSRFTKFPSKDNWLLHNQPGVWMQYGYIKKK